MIVFPNPGDGHFNIKFELKKSAHVVLYVYDLSGILIKEYAIGHLNAANHSYQTTDSFEKCKAVILKLQAGEKISVQKVIVK
jgi:hypothetical protein